MSISKTLLAICMLAGSLAHAQYQDDGQYPQDSYSSDIPVYEDSNDQGYPQQDYVSEQPAYDTQTYENNYDNNYQDQGPQAPMSKDEWTYQQAYNATNGACDLKQNPHSYACNKWNFDGNNVFPLQAIDWKNTLQGEWFTVTYVNPWSENVGKQFYMDKNPQRPSQPMGVRNIDSNQLMGSMWIQGRRMIFENWRGETLQSSPQTFRKVDKYTVQVVVMEGKVSHSFNCRDFNRNNNHHLLCAWDVWTPKSKSWKHHGYFGFLTKETWDGFMSQVNQ